MTDHTAIRRVFEVSGATALVFERSPDISKLTKEMLRTFGVGKVREVFDFDSARAAVVEDAIDFIVADPEAAGGRALEFLRWLRRSELVPNRFAPIILVASQAKQQLIKSLRDAGANFVIAKPYSPRTIRDRIDWIGRDKRRFIDAPSYVGPDRRVTPNGLPVGLRGRRRTDIIVAEPDPAAA